MTDTFCPIPWNFQAVRSNGDIRVCCQANITKNRGVLRKQDGTSYNASVDNLTESRNNDLIKTMRRNMLQGIWSDECKRCQTEEQTGAISRRIYEHDSWPEIRKESVSEYTAEDGTIDVDKFPVTYYDLRFGNMCNLSCRMCGPTDSTGWYDDWNKLWGINYFDDTHGTEYMTQENGKWVSPSYSWHGSEQFWEQIESNVHNIRHVYMAGGEPLLIERHYNFLERCVETGAAGNMVIEYNTNMTTVPSRVLDLWANFRQIRIGASVDGYGKFIEYQRFPASWDKIWRNLQKIDSGPDNIFAWIAFTVTAYNVIHMPDFMKWKLAESGLKKFNSSSRRPIITHHMAHMPTHLNVRILPKMVKRIVTDRFDEFIEWIETAGYSDNVVSKATDICRSVCDYMNSRDTPEHWPLFKQYTNKLDKIRNQNVLDVFPELAPWFQS